MILGGDDGEQLMAVTTKESIEADCWLTDARILDRATFRRAYPWTKHNEGIPQNPRAARARRACAPVHFI
jgi:hypothetical protein